MDSECDRYWFKVISATENLNKFQNNQVLEGKISLGRDNTWANGRGHTSFNENTMRDWINLWPHCLLHDFFCWKLCLQRVMVKVFAIYLLLVWHVLLSKTELLNVRQLLHYMSKHIETTLNHHYFIKDFATIPRARPDAWVWKIQQNKQTNKLHSWIASWFALQMCFLLTRCMEESAPKVCTQACACSHESLS